MVFCTVDFPLNQSINLMKPPYFVRGLGDFSSHSLHGVGFDVGADDSEGVTQTPEPNEAAEPIQQRAQTMEASEQQWEIIGIYHIIWGYMYVYTAYIYMIIYGFIHDDILID